MFETAKFSYSYNTIPRFFDSIEEAKRNGKPDLKIAGILITLSDVRRTDYKELLSLVHKEYSDLILNTAIPFRATIIRVWDL